MNNKVRFECECGSWGEFVYEAPGGQPPENKIPKAQKVTDLRAENERLREALSEAAQSLGTFDNAPHALRVIQAALSPREADRE